MLVISIIRSVTLPGAMEGLAFMFKPNLQPLKDNFASVIATAGGQMFFSLSLGMGAMVTYGSYLNKKENLEKNSVLIIIADTAVAILAGMCVLPAAFALGGADAAMAGPSLLFITLQHVFGSMGSFGPFFGLLFYLLVLIAAITSAISLVEVSTAVFLDRAEEKGKPADRKKWTLVVCIGIVVLGAIVAWDGLGSNGLWTPFGNTLGLVWLEFFDLWSEGIMMPLGALLMCLFIGWEFGVKNLGDEIELEGNKFTSRKFFTVCVKVITPVILLFVLIASMDDFNIFKAIFGSKLF